MQKTCFLQLWRFFAKSVQEILSGKHIGFIPENNLHKFAQENLILNLSSS